MEKLNKSQQALAAEATGRAERIAARYAKRYPSYADDLRSAAQLGVVQAAASYAPDPNHVWARWSQLRVHGAIKDFLRTYYVRHRQELSDPERRFYQPHRETLGELLESLPPVHQEVCRLVYGSGLSPSQAGAALGRSPRWGRLIHQESLERLRKDHATLDTDSLPD